MKNYIEFESGGVIAKAYTTIDNVYEIEDAGISLSKLFFDILHADNILSFKVSSKILDVAIKADIPDFKKRSEFVKFYFDKKRFKACDEVSAFVIQAVRTPRNDEYDGVGETENEKK